MKAYLKLGLGLGQSLDRWGQLLRAQLQRRDIFHWKCAATSCEVDKYPSDGTYGLR